MYIGAEVKIPKKKLKDERKIEDDSLYGLLSSYKALITYFKVLVSDEDKKVVIQITDNPKNFLRIPKEKYDQYREMRRLDIGINKLSVKYLSPEHLLQYFGPVLGMKINSKKVTIINNLEKGGYFILEMALQSLPMVIQNVKKIITLTPQKKYEILEKCLAENSQG